MLSKKSYFKPALFGDDLRRFSPIWGCASLALMLFPFVIWMRYQDFVQDTLNSTIGSYSYYSSSYTNGQLNTLASMRLDINEFLLDALCEAAPIAMLLYALVPAMALLNYLYQSRSALGIHALPITRSALFATHYVAGIAMVVLPLLIFCAVTVPLLLYVDALCLPVLGVFCAGVFGLYLFFFSFAIFCGMFTGQLWGVPLFYAIFNAVAALTFVFFVMLAQQFLFGFSSSHLNDTLVRCLTPVWQFSESLWLENINTAGSFTLHGLDTVLRYAIIGLCLSYAAYCIFRWRHLERAGEIVSVQVMRPIFATCLGIYGGFCTLMLYCYAFNMADTGWMFFFLALGCLFGFALGQMLLEKTLAVATLRNAKHLVVVLVLSCVCLACVRFDWLGYTPYLPDADEIESVSISTSLYADNLSIYTYDTTPLTATRTADIALIRNAHAALLADYDESSEMYPSCESTVFTETTDPENPSTALNLGSYTYYNRTTSIDFIYTLKTGQVISRTYYLLATEAELAREGSPLGYLEAYVSGVNASKLLESYRDTVDVSYYLYNANGYAEYGDAERSTKIANDALDAVLVDLAANGSKLSLLRKAYASERVGSITFNIYNPSEVKGNNYEIYFNYGGYFGIELYNGNNATAFVSSTLQEAAQTLG